MEDGTTEGGKKGSHREAATALQHHTGEHPAVFKLEKELQIHAGKYPVVYYGLHRLLRKDRTRIVTPDTQMVIEGFPRSGNSFARVAFNRAQKGKVRIAHGLHVPAQVIRAARWRIPTMVLIRKPKDAVLSFAIRDPISVDQALRYYLSFYKTVETYRNAYVLGRFEEVTQDYGQLIERINEKFGTTFSLFRHDEENVNRIFARMEKRYRERYGETHWETKVPRPSTTKEKMKHEVEHDLENPKTRRLFVEAEVVYHRLVNTQCSIP
jgi:hypothetical protein